MTKVGTGKKYLLILRFLETYSVQSASLKRLEDHFAAPGLEVSGKTLKRSFIDLQRKFGVQIKYDKTYNGSELFFSPMKTWRTLSNSCACWNRPNVMKP